MKYVITGRSGEYSDQAFWVVAVYDDKKKAEDHVEAAYVAFDKYRDCANDTESQTNKAQELVRLIRSAGSFCEYDYKTQKYTGPDAEKLNEAYEAHEKAKRLDKEECGVALCGSSCYYGFEKPDFNIEEFEEADYSETIQSVIKRLLNKD